MLRDTIITLITALDILGISEFLPLHKISREKNPLTKLLKINFNGCLNCL